MVEDSIELMDGVSTTILESTVAGAAPLTFSYPAMTLVMSRNTPQALEEEKLQLQDDSSDTVAEILPPGESDKILNTQVS